MNYQGSAPADEAGIRAEFRANLSAVIDVLKADQALVDFIADRLVEIGERVPESLSSFKLSDGQKTPFTDERVFDYKNYPDGLYKQPGEKAPNRAGLADWGAWVNAFGAKEYGRPLFLISSADLAGSTNIAGFAKGFGDFKGYGWYGLDGNQDGVLLPQEITEFANAGIMAGLSVTNLAENPEQAFEGFWAASSTYGSFSYLKYGMVRLLSQMAQDNPWKMGKVIWVAGHSGPETADDSRTHFGIYAPGVTQLFPKGHIINLQPWEYNEVPVMSGRSSEVGRADHCTAPDPAQRGDPGSRSTWECPRILRPPRAPISSAIMRPVNPRTARSTCRGRARWRTWSSCSRRWMRKAGISSWSV